MKNGFKFGSHDAPIDLEGCLVQVEASKAWFTRRVLPLSIEQLRWRPDPRHWSIAECLDHLNITLRLWLPKVNLAAAIGRRQGRTFRGWLGYERSEIDALKQIEPPVTARASAPQDLVPAPAVDPDQLVDHFYEARERYAEAVRQSLGLDLPRILVVEPIAPLIRSLGGTLAFLAAHDRRHMWQSERVRNARRFPRAVLAGERDDKGF
ncbi:MAG: hypothetical protein C5B51_13180 [Terriglobia bacterium]|nr:MAG: hypothetical protein C5B51_13180 [Terriglobia bacterium]